MYIHVQFLAFNFICGTNIPHYLLIGLSVNKYMPSCCMVLKKHPNDLECLTATVPAFILQLRNSRKVLKNNLFLPI